MWCFIKVDRIIQVLEITIGKWLECCQIEFIMKKYQGQENSFIK